MRTHIAKGFTEFLFYSGAETSAASGRIQELVESRGMAVAIRFEDDPTWSKYHNLYPRAYHLHAIMDRRLQSQLEQHGDRLSKRRMVDHAALFDTASAATEAAAQLKRARFKTDPLDARDESGKFVLVFHRKDRCDGNHPDQITAQILDLVEPSGGTYDGWACAIPR